ncbi:MAG: hypothetical protein QHH19_00255 [Candidatus Thermoplasmatota archaeon]|jgi:hypothetical protein|nr:hypothetical protein [Candidatus Thermoplasmatota archaeon]
MQEKQPEQNTVDNKIQGLIKEKEKTKEKLTEEDVSEIKKYYSLEAMIIVLLTTIAVSTFLYLIDAVVLTDMDLLYYMFSMLICPSAFFLLFLHAWALFRSITTGKESKPFILDSIYLIFVPLAFLLMYTLNYVYQIFDVKANFLTPGWVVAAILLFVEVIIAFFLSAHIIARKLSEIFPLIFPEDKTKKKTEIKIRKEKPKKRISLRSKPDYSIWENEKFFVKYSNK